MSTKLNITPGEVKQADSGLWVNDDSGFCLADFGWDEPMSDKQRNHAVANATLYADAHNTYNKCQMLPSELLDRAKGLEGALHGLLKALPYATTHPAIREAKSILSKRTTP